MRSEYERRFLFDYSASQNKVFRKPCSPYARRIAFVFGWGVRRVIWVRYVQHKKL